MAGWDSDWLGMFFLHLQTEAVSQRLLKSGTVSYKWLHHPTAADKCLQYRHRCKYFCLLTYLWYAMYHQLSVGMRRWGGAWHSCAMVLHHSYTSYKLLKKSGVLFSSPARYDDMLKWSKSVFCPGRYSKTICWAGGLGHWEPNSPSAKVPHRELPVSESEYRYHWFGIILAKDQLTYWQKSAARSVNRFSSTKCLPSQTCCPSKLAAYAPDMCATSQTILRRIPLCFTVLIACIPDSCFWLQMVWVERTMALDH